MKGFFKNVTSGFLMCLIFVVSGVVYASWTNPTSLKSNPGTLLTSDSWNQAMDNFELLRNSQSVPAGAVLSFNLQECPLGWLPANGSGSIAGEDIPDLRGRFIRGLGGSENGEDTARALRSYQTDQMQGHWHRFFHNNSATPSNNSANGNIFNAYSSSINAVQEPISDGVNGTPRVGNETRPKNIALIYCVKE